MRLSILLLGVLCGSLSAVFVRWSTAPSLVLALYRMAFSVALVAPAAWRRRKELAALSGRTQLLCLASGGALGLHFATFFQAVKTTSIASAAVLVDMEVLFVALATVAVFRKKLPLAAWLAMALAFGGAVVMALADSGGGNNALSGDLLAVLSAMLIGIYTLIGSVCRRTMTTTAYTCLVYTAALGTLLALALASGTPLTGYGAENLATALAMAVFCTLLGHSVFSWTLKYFPPSFVSTARLMDCVFSAVWGALLFSELPAMQALLGGVAVISGVVLYTKSETRGGKGESEPCGSSGNTGSAR